VFGNILKMDLKRCFLQWKFVWIVVSAALVLFISMWETWYNALVVWEIEDIGTMQGALDLLVNTMGFDVFKVVVLMLWSGLYTGSFCRDESEHYLRMVICRTDLYQYSRSKFLTNFLAVVTASVLSCILCVLLCMGTGFPLVSFNAEGGSVINHYYNDIIREHPVLFVGMIGLQFGMITAACSSVGMLFSAYQANEFIAVGLSGFVFLFVMSQPILRNTPFDFLQIVSLGPSLPGGLAVPQPLTYAWGILYPGVIVVASGVLFERRMRWRMDNGFI